jgi:hypothetical protein
MTVALITVLKHLAATLVKTEVSQKIVVSAKVVAAHLVATLVHRVVLKTAHPAALTTVHPHAAPVRRLKQAAHRLTSQDVRPVANHSVVVLTLKNAPPSLVHLVN